MGVKGNNILHAHIHQFSQGPGAVQRLPARPLMLAAFIKKRHNHVDPARFSAYRRDHPLQILEMIVRRHMVLDPAKRISQAVIAHIHHQVQIIAPNRLQKFTLSLAASKSRRSRADNIRISLISRKRDGGLMLAFPLMSPAYQPLVYLLSQSLAAF